MKSTGVVRRVDELGRIVIPIELRRNLNLKELDPKTGKGDKLEIFIEGENIILSKYKPGCVFCGNVKYIVEFKGKKVCTNCIKGICK